MAAGDTIKDLMGYMGHADLQMVSRYVKLLPQPGEDDAADRMNAYLRRAVQDRSYGSQWLAQRLRALDDPVRPPSPRLRRRGSRARAVSSLPNEGSRR